MNKKGFTLIELLAVIVILAIIALIATPAVLNIIEDSKESAARDSAMVISKAAETYYMSQTSLEGNEVTEIDLKDSTLKYKGEKPEKGYVEFDNKGNAYLKMYMNGYCVVSDYDNTVVSDKMDSDECLLPNDIPPEPIADGEAVYFNPITNSTCENYNASTNSADGFRGTEENGCMLWRVFLDTVEAQTVKLILDHNTSTSEMSWTNAMTEIKNVKDNNLYGWHAEVRSTARLITALEVNAIAPDSSGTWTPSGSSYYLHTGGGSGYTGPLGTHKYAWLFDNIDNCGNYGCNIESGSQQGYFTSTKYGDAFVETYGLEGDDDAPGYEVEQDPNVWYVDFDGSLWLSSGHKGVRPVIEVPKQKLKINK